MTCPICSVGTARVVETRHYGRETMRLRQCLACHRQFTTKEVVLMVLRPNEQMVSYYGPDWPEIRARILARDGNRCTKCGAPGAHVHHIRPIASFVSHVEANTDDNLTTLCEPCHEGAPHPRRIRRRRKQT
ncbi:MAG TPA: HNH endonuclease [Rhodothermales bacterium]|nr:HNH endonuclease [Rhodothermales bacterium]